MRAGRGRKDSLDMEGDNEADVQRFPLVAIWLASMLILAAVVFREISVFLLRIEGSSNAYGPSVFTGWQLKASETDDLMAAAGPAGVWTTNPLADPFVSWHLSIDFLLALVLSATLYRCLLAVGEPPRHGPVRVPGSWLVVLLPLIYGPADLAETGYTFEAFGCLGLGGQDCAFAITADQAQTIHRLSDVKWLVLLVNVVVIAGLYFWNGAEGRVSWQQRRSLRAGLRGHDLRVAGPPLGTFVVVGLFVVLIALPGGSALDQMPDVIRAQIDQGQAGDLRHVAASAFALVLFLVGLYVVAFTWHPGRPPRPPRSRTVEPRGWFQHLIAGLELRGMDFAVLATAAAVSAVLAVIHSETEGKVGILAAWAPLFVALGVLVMAAGSRGFRSYVEERRAAVAATTPPPEMASAPDALLDAERRVRLRAALLIGLVVLAVGISVVRATLPPFMTKGESEGAERVVLRVAVVFVLLVPVAVAWWMDRAFLAWAAPDSPTHLRRGIFGVVAFAVTAVLVAQLAVHPNYAAGLGAPATVLISLSGWMWVVAGFTVLSRRVVWDRTRQLGLGRRTPWLALVLVTWLVSGIADSTGGYHDARTLAVPEDQRDSPRLTRDLDAAFVSWTSQFGAADTGRCRDPRAGSDGSTTNRAVPLVLVAAPGGGGKAAYWTALAMDKAFGRDGFCPQSLFAASGVSGGAVGLVTTLAVPPTTDASPLVEKMTDEGPLSSALASMMLRDIPQPLTSLRGQWSDRAAELEDAWADAAPEAFGADGTRSFLDLGDGWWRTPGDLDGTQPSGGPVLVLNGSSVNDGCRALVTNVRQAASGNHGCLTLASAATDVAPQGVVSGSTDVLDRLLPSLRSEDIHSYPSLDPSAYCPVDPEGIEEAPRYTVRATTAALLAARFPVVTPSGALSRCVIAETNLGTARPRPIVRIETNYVVDGGYLENTGILTLAQVWDAVEGPVTRCNTAASLGEAIEGCPSDATGPLWIEPWFIMMENHYRSAVAAPPSGDRPRELLVPLVTATKRSTTLDTVPLEQLLAIDVSRGYIPAPSSAKSPVIDCNRFVRLAPLRQPTVEAPLGWVLAPDTRDRMGGELTRSWNYNKTSSRGVSDFRGRALSPITHTYLQDRCH